MRNTFSTFSRLAAAVTLCLAASAAASAQDRGRIRLDSLDALGTKAAETANINIDGILIRFAGSLLSSEEADEKQVKELISGVRGVYVRNYEFKAAGLYAESELSQIRSQLAGPGWSRVMSFRGRGDEMSDAEFYVAREGERVEGIVVLAAKPKEVTVINIVGSVDLEKLQKLAENIQGRDEDRPKGGATRKQ
jgi:hypothetical protein